ncbi:Bro-N domain-containing protein [Pseudomonas sp. SWRI59]|uniref:BRO-N domain-containing protein n=1 Tax=unclassified Pseudomonas TaxID=196821 RepID=UPI0016479A1E|nr:MULTISPECIES: Bro-N domain-containing protein [unclassified Pseudomonas]MBC3503604.1 Bro-N domain-containing protein [Pseudomonas sp. SWRI59]MBC3507425.1 Bro-N domain-containing protein [Pseudomonas sp. SWRI68]
MGDNSTAVSSVIPFDFRGHSVRAVSINGEPWFVAADVCRVLDVTNTTQAMQALDEDERSMFNIGRQGQANIVNDSGLYTLILRCRDAVKKGSKPHAFRKWVTSEVLPAIRKHGRYEDSKGVMVPMVDDILGKPGALRLSNIMRCRVAKMSSEHQRSATAKLASALHACFGVPRVELIPASQFNAAANLVASYAIEGEYLGPEQARPQLAIHYPLEALTKRRPEMLEHRGMGQAWLDVAMGDICARPQDLSLCEEILCELREAGFEVEGAWYEVRSLRNRLQQLNSFLTGLGNAMQQPTRYAVEVAEGRAAA